MTFNHTEVLVYYSIVFLIQEGPTKILLLKGAVRVPILCYTIGEGGGGGGGQEEKQKRKWKRKKMVSESLHSGVFY